MGVIDFDPLYFEKQRSRYASRGVALVVLLNGLAAIALLVTLSAIDITATGREPLADAMIFFGAGAVLGLLSKFLAYVRRTIRLERPDAREGRTTIPLAGGGSGSARRSTFRGGLLLLLGRASYPHPRQQSRRRSLAALNQHWAIANRVRAVPYFRIRLF